MTVPSCSCGSHIYAGKDGGHRVGTADHGNTAFPNDGPIVWDSADSVKRFCKIPGNALFTWIFRPKPDQILLEGHTNINENFRQDTDERSENDRKMNNEMGIDLRNEQGALARLYRAHFCSRDRFPPDQACSFCTCHCAAAGFAL